MKKRPAPPRIPFGLIPEELASLTVRCSCGHDEKPDWLAPKAEPFVPVKPNDSAPDHPGRWVPVSTRFICKRCGSALDLQLPLEELRSICPLYGDEAMREHEDGKCCVFTYSLVGGSQPVVKAAEDAVLGMKAELEPDRDPRSWSFHMKVLRSGQQRKKHPVFGSWAPEKASATATQLARLIATIENLHVYSISVVTRRGGTFAEKAKHDAFLALVMTTIWDLTKQGGRPDLFFDAEKPSDGGQRVHGWAERLFLDSQYCDLWAYLAHGIEIPRPRFVKPGSHPCLELADLVAWVVARHHLDSWRGNEPQIDAGSFGPVTYMGFEQTGDLLFSRQIGFPWELFYGAR
jgi:hypothetical protein